MASPWTTSSGTSTATYNPESHAVPTKPHFIRLGLNHIITTMNMEKIRSLFLSLKTLGVYVIQEKNGCVFLLQSFPNDRHIIIEVHLYIHSAEDECILDFIHLKGNDDLYSEELEKIWNFLRDKKMCSKEFVKIDHTIKRSRNEWLAPSSDSEDSKLDMCLNILENEEKMNEKHYASTLLADIVHSNQETPDKCRVFIVVVTTLLSLNGKKKSVYSYNETVRMLSVVLRILSSKDIQDLSKQDQVMNIEKILEHHTEPEEKKEIPIYQETIKNFKIVLENLQAKKD